MTESVKRDATWDDEALARASFELQRHFGREGSLYGIKACEEIARIAIVAYGRSAASETPRKRAEWDGWIRFESDCVVNGEPVKAGTSWGPFDKSKNIDAVRYRATLKFDGGETREVSGSFTPSAIAPQQHDMRNLIDICLGRNTPPSSIPPSAEYARGFNDGLLRAANMAECANPNDGRDHAECPFCSTAREIREQVS